MFHKNPRRGDVEAIAGSLQAHGQFRPIVVNEGTHTGRPMETLAGNHTLKAIRLLAERNPDDPRWQKVECYVVDVDDDRASRIVLADNRTTDLGDYDNDILLDVIGNLDDTLGLVGTGYDEGYIDALLGANEWETDDPGDQVQSSSLVDRFGVPPMTVLDTRQGYWLDRKRAWQALGINSEVGRDESLLYTDRMNAYTNWYEVKNAHPDLTDEQIEEQHQDDLKPYANGSATSTFDPVLAELLTAWHTTHGDHILDPWAGGSVRGIVAAHLGRHYAGCELRPEQVAANEHQWAAINPHQDDVPTPQWITGDSRHTMRDLPAESHDMILGCPPYYDLEEYSDDPADLSNMSTEQFEQAMRDTLTAADRALHPDRFAAFIIGAVRDKRGHLRDMKRLMIDSAPPGWHLVNDAVLINAVGTAAIRAPRAFTATRALARTHQDIVIFCKGDRKKATTRLGDVYLGELPDDTDHTN